MNQWISLSSRKLLALRGPDAVSFLHGLVTQNMLLSGPCFTALLTAQGRFHSDFFVIPYNNCLFLDCHYQQHDALIKFFEPFKMLHDLEIIPHMHHVYALCVAIGPEVEELLNCQGRMLWEKDGVIFYRDPRMRQIGIRALVPHVLFSTLPHSLLVPSTEASYHYHRLQQVMPEGNYDLTPEKSIILEYGYHDFHAISWEKGCYLGQELMARTFHRGEIRKKPYGLQTYHGAFPPLNTDIFYEKEKMGIMGSHCKDRGLAVLYREKVNSLLSSGPVTLKWTLTDSHSHYNTMLVSLSSAPYAAPFNTSVASIQ